MKTLWILLSFTASLQAVETFRYADLQTLWAIPMAGIGCRARQEIHAVDVSANFSYGLYHGKALYLFYPRNGFFYLGGGPGLLASSGNFSGSLEGTLGYQWTHSFVEFNAIYPIEKFGEPGWGAVWPGLTFGIGF